MEEKKKVKEKGKRQFVFGVLLVFLFLGSAVYGVDPWDSNSDYPQGSSVVYNNHLWQAKWWARAVIDVPGEGDASSPWEDKGLAVEPTQNPNATPTPVPTQIAGRPASPDISILGDPRGGLSFQVKWKIYGGLSTNSWEVYEDDGSGYQKIAGPFSIAEPDGFPLNPQGADFDVTDKVYGIYKYKIKLIRGSLFTWSNEVTQIVGGASKIIISGSNADQHRQSLQVTQDQGTAAYNLSHITIASPHFTVDTNNRSVVDISLNGSVLTINGLKSGRAGIKITETTSGETRLVGVRVKESTGQLPGLPSHLSIGFLSADIQREIDFLTQFYPDDRNKWMDIRYQYINAEPDSWDRGVDGWQKWGNMSIKGDFAIRFLRNSKRLGMIPFFVYYTLPGANESYDTDKRNINDPKYLGYYFKDLNFLLDLIVQEAGDELVGMILEPDFLGYMMQNSSPQGVTPVPAAQLFANTKLVYEQAYGGQYAVGILDSTVDKDPATGAPFANTIQGLVRCINYMIERYNLKHNTNIYFGWQFNFWADPSIGVPVQGLFHKTNEVGITAGRQFIRDRAQATAEYYINAGILSFGADCISIDKWGKDAVAIEPDAAHNPKPSQYFWNADIWNNYLDFVDVLHDNTNLPVYLWQLPCGHIERSQSPDPYDGGLFDELTNTGDNSNGFFYEDSTMTFFFGDTFKPGPGNRWDYFSTNDGGDPLVTDNGVDAITWGSHFDAAKAAGVIGALFGAGVGEATHGSINKQTFATKPEDDMWFFSNTQRYLSNPVLLSAGVVSPINTPVPGSTPVPTSTPVTTPTNTPVTTPTNTPVVTATNTSTPTPTPTTNTGVPAWAAGTSYSVNVQVSYNGRVYKCLQSHTGLAGWEPANVPSLWQAQ